MNRITLRERSSPPDSNYHTQVNLQECQELGVDAYIPDRKFRNRDPRFAAQKRQQARRFTLKDFH